MALWDEVVTRYPNQELVELTNSGRGNAATTIDTTVGDAAVSDIEALFKVLAGTTYDNSDARHVMVAVEGVVSLLRYRVRGAQRAQKTYWETWKNDLKDLAKVTGRNRIVPSTTSVYTPANENPSGQEIDLPFGTRRFTDIIPEPPKEGLWSDDARHG